MCTHKKDTTGPGKWMHLVLFITPKDEESKIQELVKLNNLIVQPRVCSHSASGFRTWPCSGARSLGMGFIPQF